MLRHFLGRYKNINIPMLLILTLILSSSYAHADRYDLKILQNFLTSVDTLNSELETSCKDQNQQNAMNNFQQTAQNWFLVKGLGLPTVEFMQLDHKVIFWPDSKDRLKNQVRSAVTKNPNEYNEETLTTSVLSLSAIEYLLTLSNPHDYCSWLTLIPKQHQEYATQMLSLQKYYEFSTFEKITALHASTLLSHSQLKEVLSNPNKVNWALAPAWRSESGWLITQALAKQIVALSLSLELDSQQLIDATHFLEQAINSSEPLEQDALTQYDAQLLGLVKYIEEDLAPSLDVFLGFNNFDGD